MKLVHNFRKALSSYLKKRRDQKLVQIKLNVVQKQIQNSDVPVPELSDEQERELKAYWQRYGIDMPVQWHRLLTAKTGEFHPEYIAESVFHYEIKPKMNNARDAFVWSDKCYSDQFLRGVRTATCVVRNVDGRFLNHDHELISIETAQGIMERYSQLVVKPSTDTGTGKGVELLKAPYNLEEIDALYHRNYVIQIPLKQHEAMSKLNASSINTIRVNTVLFETEAHVMSAFVKVGQSGEFADNHGHNRFFIGVRKDGSFVDYAIDHDLNKHVCIPSGYNFSGQKIPNFDKVCAAVIKAHKCIPHFGFAFWDVCICDDGEPAIVESNLIYPNVTIPQTALGPFFGEYTERIMEYITKHQAQ